MIDILDFRRHQERARAMLNIHDAAQTLDYTHAIDKNVPVIYQNKYNLLQWLDRWTPERAKDIFDNDLIKLTTHEEFLLEQMVNLYSKFSKFISSTNNRYRSNGAIYETIFDYRYITKYFNKNFNILDFGPGCARHAIAFHILKNSGIYVGMECVEVLYILQNMIMSYLSPECFIESMDFSMERKIFPDFKKITPSSILHIPTWDLDLLPENYFHLLIACHVLDELPKNDFDMLLTICKKCLKKDSIIYARGTLQNPGKMMLPRYHHYNILHEFEKIGFHPIINDNCNSGSYNAVVLKKIY